MFEVKDKNGNVLYTLKFAHYGETRELNATEDELTIADEIIKMLPSPDGCDIVRKSNDYITVVRGEWDVARIKYTERARWVNFPIVDRGNVKRRIEEVEDVKQFEADIIKSYEHILKYS